MIKKIEILFENIKKNGYKPQKELQFNKNINPMLLEDEITVNIDRNGDLLFNNGAHRLSIVKLLNIQKIPIKITMRHPQWINLRKQKLLCYKNNPNKKNFKKTTHIDLQDIISFNETGNNIFNIIQKNSNLNGSKHNVKKQDSKKYTNYYNQK
jgi:hypothetical protein